MKKRKSHAFGKNVYLLGVDKNGIFYWLEEPKWEGGWYWEFDNVKTYTNNKYPDRSNGITSHNNVKKFIPELYNEWDKQNHILTKTTFNEKECLELYELFAQFFQFVGQAKFYTNGRMFVSDTGIFDWQNKKLAEKINRKIIPVITDRIIKILTPKKYEI